MHAPSETHWGDSKHLISYLKSIPNCGIIITSTCSLDLILSGLEDSMMKTWFKIPLIAVLPQVILFFLGFFHIVFIKNINDVPLPAHSLTIAHEIH